MNIAIDTKMEKLYTRNFFLHKGLCKEVVDSVIRDAEITETALPMNKILEIVRNNEDPSLITYAKEAFGLIGNGEMIHRVLSMFGRNSVGFSQSYGHRNPWASPNSQNCISGCGTGTAYGYSFPNGDGCSDSRCDSNE
jgi:hypothetical protein